MDLIKQPWPWYVAGPLIGLVVPVLLIIGNRTFGVSSSLRHICAACLPAGIPFFKYDWKKESWNLLFVAGIVVGGFIAVYFLDGNHAVNINPHTHNLLQQQGIKSFAGLLPADIFSFKQLLTLRGFVFVVIGGFMVGFGTRYAGGCTSGHAIMGISNLQWPSLIATCCFMAGGFIMTWFILPYLLQL
ncbi:YeeE/YedE family protein [Mucilaginibacter celer]|uniref:YeeE/YedE family protein n=1 Tax=Mucilaginibacter celer TaxID=2305508 RepID=A0A494VXH5_9SPHI|nr:YeeE/YedE thiosulfate transporter family protein [Mucilaginibacter celer]AYL96028.1 YeeE/YedE family protein [Mucilaginibacter celer]